MRKFAAVLTASTILTMSVPAMAQDTPAFRVELRGDQAPSSVPTTYAWLEAIGSCSTTCGTGTRTTTYQCQDVSAFDFSGAGYGAPEADSACTATIGAKPADATSSCTVYSGCGYDWVVPPVQQTPIPLNSNPVGRIGCGFVNQTFSPYCQRTGGSTTVTMGETDHEFCSGDRPDYDPVAAGDPDALGFDRNVTQTGSCTTVDHDWNIGAWSSWSNTCSATAVRTRPVSCVRRFDGSTQADSNCNQSEDHAASQVQPIYSGCSYSRGSTVTNTGPWASGCSSSTTRTLTYNCRRSDGTDVAASECTSRGIDLTQTETGANYASCTYSWTPNDSTTGWGPSSNTCSASATQTRSITCLRSDGATVADSQCTGTRPASSRTVADYSSCSYERGRQISDSWNNGCSTNATRTQTYACRRSDGTEVSASECSSRGISLSDSQTGENYANCTYTLIDAGAGACSMAGQREKYWQCRRDQTGQLVYPGTYCGRENPETQACTPPYTYDRGRLLSDAWNSGCSANATRTQTYACRRNDGAEVSASECTSRGISLSDSQSGANYASCTYTLIDAGAGACSASGQREKYWQCRRDQTGELVYPGTYCGRNNPEIEACTPAYTYARGPATGQSWNSGCSSNATLTTTYSCRRSDGADVSTSECTNRGISLQDTSSGPNYQSCTYTLIDAGAGACNNGQREKYWQCRRNETGEFVYPGTYCGRNNPEIQACAPTYTYARGRRISDTWNSGCSTNATRTQTYACQRSDGAEVSASECTNRGISLSDSQSGENYASCTYALIDAGTGSCSGGQRPHYWQCRRNETGQMVDPGSFCGRGNPTYEACATQTVVDGESCSGGSAVAGYNWSITRNNAPHNAFTGQDVRSFSQCQAYGGSCLAKERFVDVQNGSRDEYEYGTCYANSTPVGSPRSDFNGSDGNNYHNESYSSTGLR